MASNALQDKLADYLEYVQATKSAATYDLYRSVLEPVVLPWALERGISHAKEIGDKELAAFTGHLRTRKRPLSMVTIRSYLRYLKTFLAWAEVPRGKFKPPREPKRLMDVPTRLEIEHLEQAAKDPRDRLLVRLLADSGIRLGEALSLRPEDLRENHGHHMIRVRGKSGERDVPISGKLYRRLKNFSELMASDFIFMAKRRRHGRDEVEPLGRSGVDQLFRHLAREAGIKKKVHPHALRHAWTTELVKKGVSLEKIRVAGGWTSLAMISKHYAHLQPDDAWEDITQALR